MERIAIISDIHGNLTALTEVLKDIEKRNVDKIMCLGDMLIKCASPRECVETIFSKCDVVIKGNCEKRVVEDPRIDEHIWNQNKLTKEQKEKIANLPVSYDFYLSGYKIRLMHSSPRTVHEKSYFWDFNTKFDEHFEYMFENTEFLNKCGNEKPDIVIFGHIHKPFIIRRKNKVLINPGAISNASDMLDVNGKHVTYGSYLLLEGELESRELCSISYKLVKFSYDNMAEAKKIIESDMPNKNEAYEEMKTGKYFSRLKLHLEAEKKRNG